MNWKTNLLSIAELIDAFRVVPRTILGAAVIFAGWYIYAITMWYMGIPAVERTVEVSGLLGITIPAVFGLAGKVTDWYLKTGRNWTIIKKDESE